MQLKYAQICSQPVAFASVAPLWCLWPEVLFPNSHGITKAAANLRLYFYAKCAPATCWWRPIVAPLAAEQRRVDHQIRQLFWKRSCGQGHGQWPLNNLVPFAGPRGRAMVLTCRVRPLLIEGWMTRRVTGKAGSAGTLDCNRDRLGRSDGLPAAPSLVHSVGHREWGWVSWRTLGCGSRMRTVPGGPGRVSRLVPVNRDWAIIRQLRHRGAGPCFSDSWLS